MNQNLTDITILTVGTSNKLRKRFVELPWKIYNKKEHPKWIAPLKVSVYEAIDTKKNPFYQRASIELFIAVKNGQDVGRIAAIENRGHNEHWKDRVGFYGFFECINDQEIATELFKTAKTWLKSKNLTHMRGPMNPSTNHECGLLVRGQSQHPTIMTTWNPRYYQDLHEGANLKGVKDLVAYFISTAEATKLPEKVIQHANEAKQKTNLVFRDFDKKNFMRDVEIIFDIYNSAWEDNWGFFPMNRIEFMHMAKEMQFLLDPRWAFIAEHNGTPAGFMLALPDINYILKYHRSGNLLPTGILKLLVGKHFLKTIRIITLGVKKEFRHSGIFSQFTVESFNRAQKYNFQAGEASWILEDNEDMNRPWQTLGCPLYRRWRLYEIEL